MNTIAGTYREGQIVLEGPVAWAEGTRVEVTPVGTEPARLGLREADWSDAPEAVAEWLNWYDALPPLVMTPAEEADLLAWRRTLRQHELEKMRRIEGLFP